MPHAEVIYETGAKSVVAYDDEAELQAFVAEHTRRAKAGEPGAAQDYDERSDIEPELARQAQFNSTRPAERISKVLKYDSHPGSYGEAGLVRVDAVNSLVAALASNEAVNVWELIAALRREVNATMSGDLGAHDSLYKMQHSGELELA